LSGAMGESRLWNDWVDFGRLRWFRLGAWSPGGNVRLTSEPDVLFKILGLGEKLGSMQPPNTLLLDHAR
jgi:hypothetical protein